VLARLVNRSPNELLCGTYCFILFIYLGFKVWSFGLGFRAYGLGFMVLGFRVQGLGFRL
jgi:hypothetical protein